MSTSTRTRDDPGLRRLRAESPGRWPRMVCEVADENTRSLIRIEEGEEFIAGGRFVSSLMNHFALDQRCVPLYENLFDAPSAELCTREARALVDTARCTSWRTIVESCLRRGEIAIGWVVPKSVGGYDIRFNPDRSSVAPPPAAGARIIVLAERAG